MVRRHFWLALLLVLLTVTAPAPTPVMAAPAVAAPAPAPSVAPPPEQAQSAPGADEPSTLAADEQKVLAELFTLNRALEESEAALVGLDRQMTAVRAEAERLSAEQAELTARRQARMARFGRRLRYYHERGILAPVGLLLNAESLPDFLERLAVLSRVMQQDAATLAELRSLKEQIAAKAQAVADQQAELERLATASRDRVEQQRQEIGRKEAVLASLRDERAAMEQKLALLERAWEEKAQPVLAQLGSALQTVSLNGFQPDSLAMSFFPPGATARIGEENLNRLLQSKVDLAGLSLVVGQDAVSLEGGFGGTALRIAGKFAVAGKSLLRFVPEVIWVGDFQVPRQVTERILAAGSLDIELQSIVGAFSLKEVRLEKPYLVIRAGF